MKLSHDLVREILLNMEKKVSYDTFSSFEDEDILILAPGNELATIFYHIKKMREAGLINALDAQATGKPYAVLIPTDLTWGGHQFLDNIRDDSRWKTIKAKVGAASLNTLKALAPEIVKELIRSGGGDA